MRSRSGALVLVLAVVGVALATPVGGTAGDVDPDVSIAVDGSGIDDGDTYRTGRDPKLAVDASVGPNASAGTTLSEIVVRVSGNRESSIPVNGTTASETVSPDLAHGNNTIRVIVTDDAGNVNATKFTVAKDARAPDVYLTSPYETRPWYDIADGNATGSNITLAGDIMDDSEIEDLVVRHEYLRNHSGQFQTRHEESHSLDDVGENFSLPLHLGYDGRNDLQLTVTDEYDNTRIYAFSITVRDEQEPTIDLDPMPNETSQRKLHVSGVARDDVQIRSANVSIQRTDPNESRARDIRNADDYSYDPGATAVSFNETFFLTYSGTYEVTLNATDVTGNTTTRSFTVERHPQERQTTAPEVEVDRDRTVVLDGETLFLSGAVFQGRTERVAVETRAVATDETLDYQVIHAGGATDRVDFAREVEIAGLTQVFVRATDANGNEHETDFFVNGTTRTAFTGKEPDPEPETWPRVTVTPLDDGRPGTASSSVTVERASAGDRVGIPPDDGPNAVAAAANVTLDGMYVDVSADGDFTLSVTARERGDGTLDGPSDSTPVAATTVQHSIAEADVDSATLVFLVDESYLAAHGVDPADVTGYRRSGDEWTALDTDRLTDNETHVRYRVESPGLSVFSLATASPDGAVDGNETVDASGNETDPANGTDSPGNETAENETDAGDDGGEARIVVTDVAVNATAVAPNESVRVTATLRNDGDADGTYTAGLQSIQGLNRTHVENRAVDVPAGAERNVSFVHAFAESGNHTVSVNGTQAGPVVVEGGGLLSTFAFVPLGLIGKVVAGLVGLIVVGVLVRAVLRRVGGGEASG